MRGLSGRIAIVTGGGGAIGGAVARRLAEEGCTVGILDRQASGAAEAAAGIEAAGGRARSIVVDVTDHDAVVRAVAAFEEEIGPTDVLVNGVGWDQVGTFLESEPTFWDRVIAINYRGALSVHKAVAPGMATRGRGRIVTIASDAARVGSSGEAVYAGCKAALIAFSKSLARELARAHVNVNVVCPGPTDTPLFHAFTGEGEEGRRIYEALKRSIPWKRIGQPDDVCGVVAFLASDDAAYITGQVISVSGGLTMAG